MARGRQTARKQASPMPRRRIPREVEEQAHGSRQRGYIKAIMDKVAAIVKARKRLDAHVRYHYIVL